MISRQTFGAVTPRVVVVGGGMAGATIAKYLRLWSNKTIAVTLVVPSTTYTSNIMSNLVITGQYPYTSLLQNYSQLQSTYGVVLENASATTISGFGANATGTVTLSNGKTLTCERVVLAPGIQMDTVPLTGSNPIVPAPILHAWQAGQQTLDLKSLLANMTAGRDFIMSIPPKPYRCPPGPYERACVIADYLQRNKVGSKIYVLDGNPSIVAEPVNFGNAFQAYTNAGVLRYIPSAVVKSVSAGMAAGKEQTVTYAFTNDLNTTYSLSGAVVNIIPPHKAPDLLVNAGLVPANSRFAPVDVRTFESTQIGKIHVIGDASDTSLPKAGHVGNQEAKICAAAIIALFKNATPAQKPTANSACFSPINSTQASWLTAIYQYSEVQKNLDGTTTLPVNKRMVIWNGAPSSDPAINWNPNTIGDTKYAAATEASAPSTGNFSQMTKWYGVLMSDTFA